MKIRLYAIAICIASLASPAAAYQCHVGDSAQGLVSLYEQPKETSKVVARVPSGYMVDKFFRRNTPAGWSYVKWWTPQFAEEAAGKGKKASGRAWINDERLVECED